MTWVEGGRILSAKKKKIMDTAVEVFGEKGFKNSTISEIAKKADLASILELDVGILASAKSAWPSIVVNPIVGAALETAGYDKVKLGELTIYKGYLDVGNGKTVPVLFRVKDNRLFAAVSGKESYAEALITNLNL